MLSFFTDPYPNELISSACGRYHYYIGNIDYKDTLEELFGKRSIISDFYLGHYLGYLAEQIGDKYSAEDLIWKHTIFPFYAPFIPRARREEVIKQMKNNGADTLYTKLGIVAGGICKRKEIYYCCQCVQEDMKKYGETYIHREHQLQGIFVCPHHEIALQSYCVKQKEGSRLELVCLKMENISGSGIADTLGKMQPILLKLANMALQLLKVKEEQVDKKQVLKAYKRLLDERGLLATNGRVRQQALYEQFTSFYDKELLELLECSIDDADEYNWLRVITRNVERTVHPLRHLLFLHFLGQDIEGFFRKIDNAYNPFGEPPWPCLNKAIGHYRQEIINQVQITPDYKTRLPVGTFTCSCGFSYSRRGPDKMLEDRYRIGRIKAFGEEWDKLLVKKLKGNKYALRAIAREMGCDPKTILKKDIDLQIYALHSEIDNKNEIQTERIEEDYYKAIPEAYKEKLKEVMKQNPSLSRTQLRGLINKEYTYIYRRDKEWLFMQLPPVLKPKGGKRSVDWEKKDQELLSLLQKEYQQLISKEKPIRITCSLLGRRVGQLALLEKKGELLPKSLSYLSLVTETVEAFQLRRCKKIIDKQWNIDEQIKLWEICRLGGVRTEAFNNIKTELEKYVEQLSRGKSEHE